MTADRNPTLRQQVGLIYLYPQVSGSGTSSVGALRRSLSEGAVIKERSSDKGNSTGSGFMFGLTPHNPRSFLAWQKRICPFVSPPRRYSIREVLKNEDSDHFSFAGE